MHDSVTLLRGSLADGVGKRMQGGPPKPGETGASCGSGGLGRALAPEGALPLGRPCGSGLWRHNVHRFRRTRVGLAACADPLVEPRTPAVVLVSGTVVAPQRWHA